jgi:hypothetical protein
MVASTSDPKLDFVLEQIERMVAAEGGSLELLSAGEASLEVRYTPGVNEECPDCVPTHEQVARFLSASLKVHAPHISSVRVV